MMRALHWWEVNVTKLPAAGLFWWLYIFIYPSLVSFAVYLISLFAGSSAGVMYFWFAMMGGALLLIVGGEIFGEESDQP